MTANTAPTVVTTVSAAEVDDTTARVVIRSGITMPGYASK